MALPLIPFAAGVAVGSLTTLGVTDKALRERVVNGTKDVYGRLATGTKDVYGRISTGTKEVYGHIAEGASSAVAMIPGVGDKKIDLSGLTKISDTVAAKAGAAAGAVADTVKKAGKRAHKEAEAH